jgi:DNA polymerase-1
MFIWKQPTYIIVDSIDKLEQLRLVLKKAIDNNEPIAIDLETTGPTRATWLDPYNGSILGISLAFNPNEGYYIPIEHVGYKTISLEVVKKYLQYLLELGGLYLGHNIKFDYKFLCQSGINLYPRFWDTMLALRLLNGDRRKPSGLKAVIQQYVELPTAAVSFEEAAGENPAEEDPAKFGIYAINDVIYTLYLYKSLKPRIDKEYMKLFYEAEMPLIPILAHMELLGILIDVEYYGKIQIPLEKCRDKIESYFQISYNTNINSPLQLGALLDKMRHGSGITLGKTAKENITTDEEALKTIERTVDKKHPLYKLVKHILTYRAINKTLNTYVTKFPKLCHIKYFPDGSNQSVLHTEFDQMVNSGRLSSSPNVQNITKDGGIFSVRKGFIARPGYALVEADWSGCELRLVAIDSKEPKMLQAFKDNPRDADLHQITADAIKTDRFTGKTINFSILYGATKYSISRTLNRSKEEAQTYLDLFNQIYPGIAEWKKTIQEQICMSRCTNTLYGRKRYLPDDISIKPKTYYEQRMLEAKVRELTNHIIQGTSADLLKLSMVKIVKEFAKRKLNAHILSTTHDSIVVECKKGLEKEISEILKDIMEVTIDDILLPIDISIKSSFAKG